MGRGTMGGMTEPDAQTPIATYGMTVLDTADPRALAEFYCALLGWGLTDVADDWVTIRPAGGTDGGPALSFQLAPDHVAPTWPDNTIPQQFHLDLNEHKHWALNVSIVMKKVRLRPLRK